MLGVRMKKGKAVRKLPFFTRFAIWFFVIVITLVIFWSVVAQMTMVRG